MAVGDGLALPAQLHPNPGDLAPPLAECGQVFAEALLDPIQPHPVLRAARSRQARPDFTQIEFHDPGVLRPGRVRLSPEGLRPAVGLHPGAQVFGAAGLAQIAQGLSVNVTVVAGGAGHLTLFPANGSNPGSSTINFSGGQVRANNAILRLATDGTGSVTVFNGSAGSNHLIVDVNGYFR